MKPKYNLPNQPQCSVLHTLAIFLVILISCPHGSASRSLSNQTDQLALLEFKHQISNDPNDFFKSWNYSLHFCQWQGVKCGLRHQRVVALNLSSQNILGTISPHIGNLSFLRSINLENNRFDGEIPQQIGQLFRLRNLILSNNTLLGQLPVNLSRCQNLRNLFVNSNRLVGPIPMELGSLNKLDSLILSLNSFTGFLPSSFGNLSSLRQINLKENHIEGTIPNELSQITNLIFISVVSNNLTGPIPFYLYNISSITQFYTADNRLTGTLPPNIGVTLPNLQQFGFGRNNFHGSIPDSFANVSMLQYLDISENMLTGQIPDSLGNLKTLQWLNIGLNNLTGTIPSSLYNISTIAQFGTVGNQLNGNLPPDIGLTLPNLQIFAFGDNNFQGEIPGSFSNASQLQTLAISGNRLTGQIPANLGYLQTLQVLSVGDNLLGSNATNDLSFITSLSNCTNLQGLSLSQNNFGGQIPISIGNLSVELKSLDLGSNFIAGIIPSVMENLRNLYFIALNNNLLSGSIPISLGILENLQGLRLGGNKLCGQIPSSLGNITMMSKFDLSENKLEGSIPESIGNFQNLEFLDLSHNSLNSSIPQKVIRINSLSVLDLSRNSLTGSFLVEAGTLKYIYALDVSNNKLTGNIPEAIGECLSLELLSIRDNFFQGFIPSGLAALKGIRELDLSRNSLSGKIPEGIEKLPYLRYLNLSFNKLEGEVPKTGVFQNLSAISVKGNSKLCGGIKELQLPSCRDTAKKPRVSLALKIVMIASGGVFIFALVIIFVFARRKVKKGLTPVDSMVRGLLRISYHDLYRATEGFSPRNLIGSGSFGSVYQGKLNQQEENTVAVKVLHLEKRGALKSFKAECRALRNIRHRNLVKILTYCSSIDSKGNEFKALVYDFMSNGSIDEWIHPQIQDSSRRLSLLQRLNIAVDVANAIQYLHDLCEPPVIHCDLKPSNILLDNDLIAHVGDFGLARILSKSADAFLQAQSSSMGIKGSVGYAAPEYGMGGEASKYGDIYSYGVLLLEMLTGKRPTDDTFKDGLNLHNYVRMAMEQQDFMMIVDPILLTTRKVETGVLPDVAEERDSGDEIMVERHNKNKIGLSSGRDKWEKCIAGLFKIGVGCALESAKERMGINDVLRELQHIRNAYVGDRVIEIQAQVPC